MSSQSKMGFWSLTSLVAGSQIGTGIFLLPASLVAFGAIGMCSWFITATGAILLALVFARLSVMVPKTGGPHTFIEKAFGRSFGFFSAWTYWVISWVSSPIVVISIVTYLKPVFGEITPLTSLFLGITFLSIITAINLRGVRSAGYIEVLFTLLKLLPLLLVPLAGLFFFNNSHFTPFNPTSGSALTALNGAALLTLWGFIGVECATTPAESVQNPKKTIPRALIVGTLLVAVVYIFSSIVIMGVVPPEALAQSTAPFADAAQMIFGGNWHLLISICASLVCLGTLNSWVLTSGQIAMGAAKDGHLPRFFAEKNTRGAPRWGLIISSFGMVPILFATLSDNLMKHVNLIIEVSVTAFLFVYLFSVLSYLRLCWKNSETTLLDRVIAILALLFCCWALYSSGVKMIALASIFPVLGIPIYLLKKRQKAESLV